MCIRDRHEDVVEGLPADVAGAGDEDGAGIDAGDHLLLADPRLGDGGRVGRELARRRARHGTRMARGEFAQLGEVDEALGDVRASAEELMAAQPETLDQAVDEEIRSLLVERGSRRALDLEEIRDALTRLGRELRGLERRRQSGDHVELAPARQLHAARDVDRVQLDRRPR